MFFQEFLGISDKSIIKRVVCSIFQLSILVMDSDHHDSTGSEATYLGRKSSGMGSTFLGWTDQIEF